MVNLILSLGLTFELMMIAWTRARYSNYISAQAIISVGQIRISNGSVVETCSLWI